MLFYVLKGKKTTPKTKNPQKPYFTDQVQAGGSWRALPRAGLGCCGLRASPSPALGADPALAGEPESRGGCREGGRPDHVETDRWPQGASGDPSPRRQARAAAPSILVGHVLVGGPPAPLRGPIRKARLLLQPLRESRGGKAVQ